MVVKNFNEKQPGPCHSNQPSNPRKQNSSKNKLSGHLSTWNRLHHHQKQQQQQSQSAFIIY